MATIKDVAREAGLTVTTVSRVLNNRGYISENARQKVNDAMKKLNYQPNEMTRSLRKKSNLIGLIVPHIRHPYFAEMISYLEREAYELGYRIMLCNTKDRQEREREYVDICKSNRVAGIIIFSGSVEISTFEELEIPVITMERYLETATASVRCDNKTGGVLAARKLIEAGCKNLIHVGSPQSNPELPADDRARGFVETCEKAGVGYQLIYPDADDDSKLSYADVVEKILKEHSDVDGIFASSDIIAAQIIQGCHAIGKKIPEDLKLIGFDDILVAEITSPQLTTIHQPIKEMASLAMRLIEGASEGEVVPRESVLPVRLVERETV